MSTQESTQDDPDSTSEDTAVPWVRWGIATAVLFVVATFCLAVTSGLGMSQTPRWFDIKTPSMGQAAPVGSLVITTPKHFDDVTESDIITFRPNNDGPFVTHRVVGVEDGSVTTKGDVNPDPDPWVVTEEQYVGTVTTVQQGVGWLLRGLPWLLLGWLIVWFASGFIGSPGRRWHVRMLGSSLTFSLVALFLRPWARTQALGFEKLDGDAIAAYVVSTGMMPTRVKPVDGDDEIRLLPGETGTIVSDTPNSFGVHQFIPTISLYGWWLVGVIGACFLPLLYVLIVGTPQENRRVTRKTQTGDILPSFPPVPSLVQLIRDRRNANNGTDIPLSAPMTTWTALASGLMVPIMFTVAAFDTTGAMTISIINTDNRAGIRELEPCSTVWASHPETQFAYSMFGVSDGLVENGKTEPDIRAVKNGGAVNGTYTMARSDGGPTGDQDIPISAESPCADTPAGSLAVDTSSAAYNWSQRKPLQPCLLTGGSNASQAEVPLGANESFSADIWFRVGNGSPNWLADNPGWPGAPIMALTTNIDSWGSLDEMDDTGSQHVEQPFRVSVQPDGQLQASMIRLDDGVPYDSGGLLRYRMTAMPVVGDVRDGQWHHLAVTAQPINTGAGLRQYMSVYVDGQEIMNNIYDRPFGDSNYGYWRVGCQFIQARDAAHGSYFHANPPSQNSGQVDDSFANMPRISFDGNLAYFAAFRDYVLRPEEVKYRHDSRNGLSTS